MTSNDRLLSDILQIIESKLSVFNLYVASDECSHWTNYRLPLCFNINNIIVFNFLTCKEYQRAN